jgi:hypothetical protein
MAVQQAVQAASGLAASGLAVGEGAGAVVEGGETEGRSVVEVGAVPVLQILDVNGASLFDSTSARSFVSSDENVVCFNMHASAGVSGDVLVRGDFLLRVRHVPETGGPPETILRAALHAGAISIAPYVGDASQRAPGESEAPYIPDVVVAGDDGGLVVRITKASLDIASADPRVPDDTMLELILSPHARASDTTGQTSVSAFPGSFQRDVLAWRNGLGAGERGKEAAFTCANQSFALPRISGPGIDSWILLEELCPYISPDAGPGAAGDIPAAILSLLPSLSLSSEQRVASGSDNGRGGRDEEVLASKLAKLRAQALSTAGSDAGRAPGASEAAKKAESDDLASLEREFEAASVSGEGGEKALPAGKGEAGGNTPASPDGNAAIAQEKNDDDIDELEAYLASLEE